MNAPTPAAANLMTTTKNPLTAAESRALKLLGAGNIPHAQVALAVGLSESRISQLLSDEEFSKQVQELRYQNLAKHNELDEKYDSLESELAEKLKSLTGLMFRPMEVAKTLQLVNGLKRRGVSSPESVSTQQPVVPLIMPTVIIQQFTKSVNNQIVEAGNQTLLTIQPGALQKLHGLKSQTPLAIETDDRTIAAANENGTITRATLEEKIRAQKQRQAASS